MEFNIDPVSASISKDIRKKIDNKTKPVGSLGKLEKIAHKVGLIQQTSSPTLNSPVISVFAGDHGIAGEGVSAYPQEVTYQMVYNFLNNGAAINVFARQHEIDLYIVDAGVNHEFAQQPGLIDAKIRKSTRNFLNEPAMTIEECKKAIVNGADIIKNRLPGDCNCIGFGEMGIGNTSSASILMHLYTGISLGNCTGTGTGLDENGLTRKIELLSNIVDVSNTEGNPLDTLAYYGGFEIAMMCGAYLQAASERMVILVDGFIATVALLAASQINKYVVDYCVFTHLSDEKGHQYLLDYLSADPVLSLKMRLGEGTGAAICYPIIQSSVLFLNEMASFESAQVSGKNA